MTDNVNAPKHYLLKQPCEKFPYGLEVMDIREALAEMIDKHTTMSKLDFSDFDRGLEYFIRAPFKNGLEDFDKSEFYSDRIRNRMREKNIDNFKKL